MNPWKLSDQELAICFENPKFDVELLHLLYLAYEEKNICCACDPTNKFIIPALCSFHFKQWRENKKKFENKYFKFERDGK